MRVSDLLGESAGVVAILALIPYVLSILRGQTKPNRASWLIWSVVGGIILASYHSSGATTTIWLTLSYAVLPVIVFALSFKYGVGGYAGLDIVCVIGALAGLALWRLTNNPQTALYLNVIVDFLGFLPTLKKVYLQPETESRPAWILATLANSLNVMAITSWHVKIALYPIYLLALNASMAILVMWTPQRRLDQAGANHRR